MSNNKKILFDENNQSSDMEQGLTDENVSSRVPSETWVKIFTMARHKSKNLSKLRLVCKQWQAVIDEHFDMKVKLNEDKMDVNSIINFTRVVHCNISKFCGEYGQLSKSLQLFWDPTLLTSLILRGTITKCNFLLIAQQCQFVTEFSLIGCSPIGDSDLFEVVANEQKDVLSKFMGGLQKLVVNGMHIASTERNPSPVILYSVLNWPMTKLKTLVVRASFWDAVADKLFFGLLKNFCSLESVEFTFRSTNTYSQITPIVFVLPTLSTLNINVKKWFRLQDWLPFIKAQNSIKHLKMASTESGIEWNPLIQDAILSNAKSLESLELRKIDHSLRRMSLQFLTQSPNLKSLIMQGELELGLHELMRPSIVNLDLLPDTIESLVLENFECNRQEFARISERVENLQTKNIVF